MTTLADLVGAGRVAEDVPLAPLTTYKFGGPADYFAEVDSEEDLLELTEAAAEEGLAVLVVGRGSNLVIADDGFRGLAMRLGTGLGRVEVTDGGEVVAGGAASLPTLARTSVRAGRLGLEWCVGVPGSVGGAVRMNAGCHGSDISKCLTAARVVDIDRSRAEERTVDDLGLGYRTSRLTDNDVVTSARFHTVPGSSEEGERRIREVTQWRRKHQPGGTLNAGSVFKNPPGDAAGRIIDETGLKGFRVGSVAVSDKHANFFVADPGARAQDLFDLVWAVRSRVGRATGTWLEPEIHFAGAFRPSPDRADP